MGNSQLLKDKHLNAQFLNSIENSYDIEKHLNIGPKSIFFEAWDKYTDVLWAIQEIEKKQIGEEKLEKFCRYIEILKEVEGPNIVKFLEIIETQHYFYLVFEILSNESLLERITNSEYICEECIKKIMYDILYALSVCHSKQVVHKDVRPEKFLYDMTGKSLKLIGFQHANKEERLDIDDYGQLHYRAPETFRNEYTAKSDVWSAGVIFYVLVTKKHPFIAKKPKKIVRMICQGISDDMIADLPISHSGLELLSKMLDVNESNRISLTEARNSSWFTTDGSIHRRSLSSLHRSIFFDVSFI